MFTDKSSPINGLPSMHQYVVTWVDYTASGNFQVNAQYGEIDNTGSPLNSAIIDTSGTYIYADVAASNNISTGDLTAYFAIHFFDGSSELRHGAWVCNGTGSPTVSLLSGIDTYFPHIEAMGLYDPAIFSDPWVIAAPNVVTVTNVRLLMFDSANISGVDFKPVAPYFDNGAQASAVAAGSGDPVGVGAYANDNYTVGWNARSYGYISGAVDYTTGSVNTTYPGYYQINRAVAAGCQKQSLAITSTSNLGKGLLSVWYSGTGRIFYKQSPDITAFRPAQVGIADNVLEQNLFTVSPNPSRDIIQIRGISNSCIKRVEIYNLLGQLIYSDNVNKVKVANVDIGQLANGIYNMSIYSDDTKTVRKIQVLR